jgi:hypothetical protein
MVTQSIAPSGARVARRKTAMSLVRRLTGLRLAPEFGEAEGPFIEGPAVIGAALGAAEPFDEPGEVDGGIEQEGGGFAAVVGAEVEAEPEGFVFGEAADAEAGVIEQPAFGGFAAEVGGLLPWWSRGG